MCGFNGKDLNNDKNLNESNTTQSNTEKIAPKEYFNIWLIRYKSCANWEKTEYDHAIHFTGFI